VSTYPIHFALASAEVERKSNHRLFFAPLDVLYARFGRGPPGTTIFKFPWHFFQCALSHLFSRSYLWLICRDEHRQTWITFPLTAGAVALAYYATTLKSASSTSTYAHKVRSNHSRSQLLSPLIYFPTLRRLLVSSSSVYSALKFSSDGGHTNLMDQRFREYRKYEL